MISIYFLGRKCCFFLSDGTAEALLDGQGQKMCYEVVRVTKTLWRHHCQTCVILDFIDWASVENENLFLHTFTCSKSAIETLENVNMFKVNNKNTRRRQWTMMLIINDVVLVSFLLTLNIFQLFSYCFYCWIWASGFSIVCLWTCLLEYNEEGSTRTNLSLYFLRFHSFGKSN